MVKDGLRFNNKIEWFAHNEGGELIGSGCDHNDVCTRLIEDIVDHIKDDSSTYKVTHMSVGSSGADGLTVTSAGLTTSRASTESVTGGITDNGANVVFSCSFTGITGTVNEAGLFPADANTDMLAFNQTIEQLLASTDTLTINWTVTVADS